MAPHRRAVRIQWGDCDPAGIVYFPRYFAMFDDSTAALFEHVGFRKPQLLATFGIIGFPVVDVSASFRAPCRFGDDVVIESVIEHWQTSSFKVLHRLLKNDLVAIECREVRVWAEHDASRPNGLRAKPIDEDLKRRFES